MFTWPPLHTTTFAGVFTTGVGFTLMLKVCELPWHPFASGVTVMFDVIALFPLLVALNPLILSVPDVPVPIVPLLLLQL